MIASTTDLERLLRDHAPAVQIIYQRCGQGKPQRLLPRREVAADDNDSVALGQVWVRIGLPAMPLMPGSCPTAAGPAIL